MDIAPKERPHSVLQVSDLQKSDIEKILKLASMRQAPQVFAGRGAALIFEHPSARTRNAAEMAVFQLGGHPISIAGAEIGIDRRESAEDIARVLARYHCLIGARVASHETLVRMNKAISETGTTVPVVNLLSNRDHVTQALADLMTIKQKFDDISAIKVAYIGDPNNVCYSLAQMASIMGFSLQIAAPEKYLEKTDFLCLGSGTGSEQGAFWVGSTASREKNFDQNAATENNIMAFTDPYRAVKNADVLYTDVFVSMGEEKLAEEKRRDYKAYVINKDLLEHAAGHAVVMHCLPAHRGEEITAEVLEGPKSIVFDQAENRMHAMRGLFAYLLGASSDTDAES
ncbi:MAG: ornithine carbamoyltransferase [Firmicutes bacterium]|jgi:ornithine carbamoyltransferase|nr:ornithine carbamoyltransferase [Bacillota bacterium]